MKQLAFVVTFALISCGQAQRASNAVDVAGYTLALEQCRAEGKDAGSYVIYEMCAEQADIKYGRDGGTP